MSREKMPERVWVGHHDYGGVCGSYDLSRLPPDAADRKASTEYVRADLYEAMREVLVGIAADGCTIHDEDPPCEMGDPACVARKFLAAHDAMMKEGETT